MLPEVNLMANEKLSQAKNAKNDEFYTQYADIQFGRKKIWMQIT